MASYICMQNLNEISQVISVTFTVFCIRWKVDYLKTVAVAVLECKQNVSFIVFHKVVYFTKRIYHFCNRLAEEKLWL